MCTNKDGVSSEVCELVSGTWHPGQLCENIPCGGAGGDNTCEWDYYLYEDCVCARHFVTDEDICVTTSTHFDYGQMYGPKFTYNPETLEVVIPCPTHLLPLSVGNYGTYAHCDIPEGASWGLCVCECNYYTDWWTATCADYPHYANCEEWTTPPSCGIAAVAAGRYEDNTSWQCMEYRFTTTK